MQQAAFVLADNADDAERNAAGLHYIPENCILVLLLFVCDCLRNLRETTEGIKTIIINYLCKQMLNKIKTVLL